MVKFILTHIPETTGKIPLLEQDTSLCNRTVLFVQNIIQSLGFSLHNTYFSFQGQFCEKIEGAAMGSLISPIVPNLYMEHFERTALRIAATPQVWLRYVHDMFVIQQVEHKQNFLKHINNVDLAIKFTVENNQQDCTIPFLDTIVKPEANNTLSLTV